MTFSRRRDRRCSNASARSSRSDPGAVLAFRDLDQMSDDDLRNTLEDALQMIERMS